MHTLVSLAATASVAGESLLNADLKSAFTQGLADVTATHTEALTMIIPVALGIVIASSAANFVLGKVKGVFGWAS